MRARGMTHDTGFVVHGRTSREHFDPAVVRRELAVIRDDLHRNAVQIIGGDPDRLERAVGAAAELGLEVWFSPYPLELDPEQILALFRDCAGRAERLRRQGAAVPTGSGTRCAPWPEARSRSPSPGSAPRPTAVRETAVDGCWKWSSTTRRPGPRYG